MRHDEKNKRFYKITLHIDNEEKTYSFSTQKALDEFTIKLRREGVIQGDVLTQKQYTDKKREQIVLQDGVFVDIYDDRMKLSFSDGAHEKVKADAQAANLSVDDYIQGMLQDVFSNIKGAKVERSMS